MKTLLLLTLLGCAACHSTAQDASAPSPRPDLDSTMDLGIFSVSLAVQDLAASRAFYEKLGFESQGGSPEQNYLILRNGNTVVGLFQEMFEQNILTFNPGWDARAQEVDPFTDVRELQARLVAEGITPVQPIDEAAGPEGPASFVLADPDGNLILVDQHR